MARPRKNPVQPIGNISQKVETVVDDAVEPQAPKVAKEPDFDISTFDPAKGHGRIGGFSRATFVIPQPGARPKYYDAQGKYLFNEGDDAERTPENLTDLTTDYIKRAVIERGGQWENREKGIAFLQGAD